MLKHTSLLDLIAVLLSALCVLHCLALPVFLLALPMLSLSFLADEWVHLVLLSIALPISLVALWHGCRQHRNQFLLISGVIGIAFMAFAVTEWGNQYERSLTLIGVLLLAATHSLNWLLMHAARQTLLSSRLGSEA